MAFQKKVGFGDCPTIKIGGKDDEGNPRPTQVEGYYLGSKVTPDKGYGPGLLHFFKTKQGDIGVWGKTMMNNSLTEDLVGQMVRVTYKGLGKKTPGKNPAQLFDVEHDPDNVLEEAAAATEAEASHDPEEESEQEAPLPPAKPKGKQAVSPESQAKVAAFLAGKKS